MAVAGGVQVNAVTSGSGSEALCSLASATDGQCLTTGSDVAADLRQIRSKPPAPSDVDGERAGFKARESPDIPVVVALLAVAALAALPLVRTP